MCKVIFLFLFLFSASSFATEYNPAAARTNAKLGLDYLKKGLYSESKDRLLTAIHEDPKIAAGWYCMAYYLEKTNNAIDAEKYYQKAIQVEPHSGQAKNNYGTFLCRQKQYSKAMTEFLNAAQEPSYLDVASAYQNAGICAMRIPNNTLAMTYFNKALDNNPSLPLTLLNMAHLSYLAGDTASAEKYFFDFKKLELYNQPANVVQKYRRYVFSGKMQHKNQLLPSPS